jgi:hypothetical protein
MRAGRSNREIERVLPLQAFEPGEICIGRAEGGVVFDGERRELGVGHEVGRGVALPEQALENRPMDLRGVHEADAGLVQPALHARHRLLQRERPAVQAGIGADADKGRQHRPAETDRIGAAELRVPPGARHGVVFGQAVLGVEQQVGVDEDHG